MRRKEEGPREEGRLPTSKGRREEGRLPTSRHGKTFEPAAVIPDLSPATRDMLRAEEEERRVEEEGGLREED